MYHRKLLVIGFVWPEPTSSAAGSRMIQLLKLFQEFDFHIIFASTATESEHSFNLSDLGIQKHRILLNHESFDDLLIEMDPTIVLFDRFNTEEQFGWRVSLHCPNAIKILDTEDLHCLRITRGKSIKKNIPFNLEDLLLEDITKREIASILRSDLSLMIAEFEMQLLQSFFNIDAELLFYLPYEVTSVENESVLLSDFDERVDFVFIGNFLHEPNWDAVLQLKKSIWPLIRKEMPDAILKIYGAYPSPKVFQLHNEKEGFLIMGRAESASKVMGQARVMLAPIRFGAGVKGKLIEGMQFGMPSITTTIGAESINGTMHWNGFIADDAHGFAAAAVALYSDPGVWNRSRENGYEILRQRFIKTNYVTVFKWRLEKLLVNLMQHRKQNFIGALLQHHTLRSTEYMSRWIQEKNK